MLYEHSVYNCKTAGPPCQNSFRKGFNQLSDLLIYMLINRHVMDDYSIDK